MHPTSASPEVLFGVVSESRARFELENHAHDIYDAFHAIHARAVRRATFFHFDEMVHIIEAAHHVAGAPGVCGVPGEPARPLMGHNILVSNLWEVRDIWDWLAPGWSDIKTKEAARPARQTSQLLACDACAVKQQQSTSGRVQAS